MIKNVEENSATCGSFFRLILTIHTIALVRITSLAGETRVRHIQKQTKAHPVGLPLKSHVSHMSFIDSGYCV